jgi:hypothetical protein
LVIACLRVCEKVSVVEAEDHTEDKVAESDEVVAENARKQQERDHDEREIREQKLFSVLHDSKL